MSHSLLKIVNLHVTIQTKVVLDDLSLDIDMGQVITLVGANGSGKTSLAMSLLGDPNFKVHDLGQILLDDVNILKMSCDERAKMGLFVAWQNPISIPGVSVFSLCKSCYEAQGKKIKELVTFKKKLESIAERVGLPKEYIGRNVNEGFSGGEKKRLELLQLILLKPKLAVLDEIDSGLDSAGIKILVEVIASMKIFGTSFLIITHNKQLLKDVVIDKTWEMKSGKLSARV